MTKAEIASEIAKTTGIDKAAVVSVIEQFMTVVKDSLAHGENVYLRGFGSFIVKQRAEKTSPQHQQEHHHSDSCPQHPGFQTRQLLQRGSRQINGRDQKLPFLPCNTSQWIVRQRASNHYESDKEHPRH